MNSERFKRKLSAILSADVVGYSRLMSEDDNATVSTLTSHREMMSTLIKQHHGRVVDSPGDNLLAEFESVLQSVNCAVEIQRELAERNAELPEERKMEYRVGVNLGDVIKEGERIYGDGVNIAARLESLAVPGGICISGFVYNQVKNRLKLEYESMGEQSVKNIKEPVPVYRVLSFPGAAAHRVIKAKKTTEKSWRNRVMIAAAAVVIIVAALAIWNFYLRSPSIEPASIERMTYPLPDKPSIAVLPFDNMSGDPEQDYIGDGLSENIISALSVSTKLFVMARNATFTYKGTPVKPQQVAEDLGVQYILEGSVQKSGEQLRVTAQFIDALTGHHLWTEVYNREMKEFFGLQDEITKKIVGSLHVELGGGEDARLYAKYTDNLEAWKHFIKGNELWEKLTKEDNAKAREHFRIALKLDPDYVPAIVMLSQTHSYDLTWRWSDSPFISMKKANELIQEAFKIDDHNPIILSSLAFNYLYQRKYEKAISEGEKAIIINPNLGNGYITLGVIMCCTGSFEESITMFNKGLRLNPKTIPALLPYLMKSYIFLERFEDALEVCNLMEKHAQLGRFPKWAVPTLLPFVYVELGREEEARIIMADALKMYPEFSLEWIKRFMPYKNPAHLQRELDAYRKAGLPENSGGAVQ